MASASRTDRASVPTARSSTATTVGRGVSTRSITTGPRGVVSNRRVMATFDEPSLPDGATVDADGYVWIAAFLGGEIRRYAPDGTLDRRVQGAGDESDERRLRWCRPRRDV